LEQNGPCTLPEKGGDAVQKEDSAESRDAFGDQHVNAVAEKQT
jgi:hypothetical protein